MNRKKKISDIYSKKLKKAKSHLNPKANNNKTRYISKADREKAALEQESAVELAPKEQAAEEQAASSQS
jgi:hypothetical protein